MVVPMTAISNKKQPFNHSQTPTGSGFKGDTDTLRPLTDSVARATRRVRILANLCSRYGIKYDHRARALFTS